MIDRLFTQAAAARRRTETLSGHDHRSSLLNRRYARSAWRRGWGRSVALAERDENALMREIGAVAWRANAARTGAR